MKDRVLSVGSQVFLTRTDLKDRVRIDIESVHGCDANQFVVRLRERDVQDVFAAPDSFGNKLKPQGSLPRAGFPFNKVEMAGWQTTTKNIVQTCTSGTTAGANRYQSFFHCVFSRTFGVRLRQKVATSTKNCAAFSIVSALIFGRDLSYRKYTVFCTYRIAIPDMYDIELVGECQAQVGPSKNYAVPKLQASENRRCVRYITKPAGLPSRPLRDRP